MFVFVQATNIPRALRNKEQMQRLLCNVGRVNQVLFEEDDEYYCRAMIHLETSKCSFSQCVLTPYGKERIILYQVPDKFVKTMIGEDLYSHITTPNRHSIWSYIKM